MSRRSLLVALCALLLSLLGATRAFAAGTRVPFETTDEPGTHFAREAAALHAAGYALRRLDVAEDGERLEVALVVVKAGRAERLALSFEGERPARYRREATALPSEERVYPAASELFTALGRGPVMRLEFLCASFALVTPRGDAAVDPYDYYVVGETALGPAASMLMARELGRLSSGAVLVDVRRADDDPAVTEVDLYDGGWISLRARTTREGRIASVEVRRSPSGMVWRTYKRGDALGAHAARTGRVTAIHLGDAGATLVLSDGTHLTVADGDYEELDEGCGC